MSTESSILRSFPVCLLFAAAATFPADAQAPIAPGTVLLDLSASPASQLVLSKEELEKRLCDSVYKDARRTKDPDPSLIIYDDSLDVPTNPPDPPPDPPPGGGVWHRPSAESALFPTTVESAPRLVYVLPEDAIFDSAGRAQTRIEPARLCGASVEPLLLSCGSWNATLRLDPVQEAAALELFDDGSGTGGTFTLQTTHALRLAFHHPETDTRVSWVETRTYSGFGSWSRNPGTDGVEKSADYSLDTDCDGLQETWVKGTTELHLGWDGATEQGSCLAESTGGGRLCMGPQKKESTTYF